MSEKLEQVKQLAGELLEEMDKEDILDAIEGYLDLCEDYGENRRPDMPGGYVVNL